MQLLGNTVLIKLDPESNKTKSGVLFKPEGACEDVLRTGVVVDVGPGKYLTDDTMARQPMDVKVGDGVVFVKFVATHTETAKGIREYLKEDEALLQLSDIMLVFDHGNPPEFGQ